MMKYRLSPREIPRAIKLVFVPIKLVFVPIKLVLGKLVASLENTIILYTTSKNSLFHPSNITV